MYYKPDLAATGLLVSEIAEELAKRGNDITIVASVPHYSTNSIWKEYRGKLRYTDMIEGVRVERVWAYVPKNKDNIVLRFFSYLAFTISSFVVGLLTPRPDVIMTISPSPPLTNGLTGALLSRLTGAPLVSNVQDIYPDVAIHMGVMTNPAIISFYKWLEGFVYRKSTSVTVISEGFRRNLAKKGVPQSKLHVMPNFVNTDKVRPLERANAFSTEHSLDSKFVVLFAGNVGMSQGLSHVLDAAHIIRDEQDIVFMIVGNGASKPALEDEAAKMKLDNVRFLPYQPYDRVPEVYSAADVCLVPLRRDFTEDSVPSKLWTIMGCARPVIASVEASSDTAHVVRAANCGIVTQPEDGQEIANAILTLYRDRPLMENQGRQGRAYVEKYYSLHCVAELYECLFLQYRDAMIGSRKAEGVVEREPAPKESQAS